MKYVDIARGPGSAIRVFTSSERLATQLKKTEMDGPKVGETGEVGQFAMKTGKLVKKNEMGVSKVGKIGEAGTWVKKIEMGAPRIWKLVKENEMDVPNVGEIGEVGQFAMKIGKLVKKNEMGVSKGGKIGEVGKWVKKIEMGAPRIGKLVKENEMDVPKVEQVGVVGKMVKRIQVNDPKVGKVGKLVRVGQKEFLKLEQDAMLAEAGEEDGFIKCSGDITGMELPWRAVKEAREKELKYLRELGVYETVDERAAAAKYNVTPIDTKWVGTDSTFEGKPM